MPLRTPSKPVIVIAALACIMAAIGIEARLAQPGGQSPRASAVQAADLVMQDHDDGSVTVTQAGTGALVETVPPATNGFLRVVLAGLVRERRREEMGAPTAPFRLTRWSDGRLTIDDSATGKLIELEAFGPTNEAAFARLLELSRPPPARPSPPR